MEPSPSAEYVYNIHNPEQYCSQNRAYTIPYQCTTLNHHCADIAFVETVAIFFVNRKSKPVRVCQKIRADGEDAPARSWRNSGSPRHSWEDKQGLNKARKHQTKSKPWNKRVGEEHWRPTHRVQRKKAFCKLRIAWTVILILRSVFWHALGCDLR